MSHRLPAPLGEVIDRSSAISFTWNGKKLQGFEGDTIASALADSLTGEYVLRFLPPDTYDVDAEAAGFQPASVAGVVVGPAQNVTGVDFTLSP